METKILMQEITPLYNSYQEAKKTQAPAILLGIMWEIGNILEEYISESGVAPHTLFRTLYGKSESSSNVTQKSYIAREFLGRSYRVRRIFPKKRDILVQFPRLTAFEHFRAAMPFFDNPKYALNEKERAELFSMINSIRPNVEKKRYIQRLQVEKINRKNPRTQQLASLATEKDLFVNFYNEVFEILSMGDYKKAQNKHKIPEESFLSVLSRNCGALSADGLRMEQFEIPDTIEGKWRDFSLLIQRLISKESPVERRRFRRLIPPNRMFRLSEMIYALSSPDRYIAFQR
jgi:hypothetical protein